MFEWAEQFGTNASKDWDVIAGWAGWVALKFTELPQIMQPVALLILMMAAALAMFVVQFVFSSLLSKVSEPVDVITTADRAQPGYPERPKGLNFEEWFLYYVRWHYIANRSKGIGWFSFRLIIWIGMMSVLGSAFLGALNSIGVETINHVTYTLICVAALTLALTHGYAHNTGRRLGRGLTRVKVGVFAKAFVTPVALTIGMFGIALVKHQVLGVAKWALASISIS